MSKSFWKVNRFTKSTIASVVSCMKYALEQGADYETAARFAGYHEERNRQAGPGMSYFTTEGRRRPHVIFKNSAKLMWEAAVRSGHRYAKGVNRDNYIEGTRKALVAAVNRGENKVDPETPLYILVDMLFDKSLLPM